MIYNPLQEFDSKFKNLHLEHTKKYFDDLRQRSNVDVAQNQKTVKEYNELKEHLSKLRLRCNWLRVLRVFLFITLILIPLAIWWLNPKIRALRARIEQADDRLEELLALAWAQMQPLNALFDERDALRIIEKTISGIAFAPTFSAEQERDMVTHYDFENGEGNDRTTLDLLAGHYNENPFLFESQLIHRMGQERYHGTLVISWTESYRDSEGRIRTRTRTQTLHASVVKPKPFYSTQTFLNYCAQGGPELSFTRDATHLEQKSEKEIDKYVKKGEKKLKKMTDKAIKDNKDFVSMANADFEVLFDALDRTHEVQFRTLFTPLAQTNMIELIRSRSGYGDDFHFIKRKRTNRILTQHSQGRPMTLHPAEYHSYSFDVIKQSFINKNVRFFKDVYFDFAPIWAIPLYQEQPVASLHPVPDTPHVPRREEINQYSRKECEALFNTVFVQHVVHPNTKTRAILKSDFVEAGNGVDEVHISAYSYDVIRRVEFVSVLGGDGHFHAVPVPWDQYIPLEADNVFLVGTKDRVPAGEILASRNDLCICHKKTNE